jgi:uncharacterized protein (TIGR02452 family)
MNRATRAAVAAATDRIVETGRYAAGRVEHHIAPAVEAAVAGTHLHRPDDPLADPPVRRTVAARIEVTGESTLAAARRLVAQADGDVACLNFASAKRPGGGYRSGAQAQEESLARASALAVCLEAVPEYYDQYRRRPDPVYTDGVICSPDVPVFRDDDGGLLAEAYAVTFLTAAAPNAGALAARGWRGDIRTVLERRARRVLGVAASHGHGRVVLGAWGCGVFRNDPSVVADVFASLLGEDFARSFDLVTFAVLDTSRSASTHDAFRRRLAAG